MTTAYEAVIFLNNIGTTLLRCHQYDSSVATLSDACRIHRCLIGELKHHHQRSGMDTSQITVMIQRASNRLAQSDNSNSGSTTDFALDPLIVLEAANVDGIASLLRYGPTIDRIDFVVRMENHASGVSSSSCDCPTTMLDAAILFLNYGVACRRASYCSQVGDHDDEVMSDALHHQSSQLLQLSHRMVHRVLEDLVSLIHCQRRRMPETDYLWERAVMIAMFTSAHISHIRYWQESSWEDDDVVWFHHSDFEKMYRLFRDLTQQGPRPLALHHAASA